MSSKTKKAPKKKVVSTLIVVEEQEVQEVPVAIEPVEPTQNVQQDDTVYQDAISAEDRRRAKNEETLRIDTQPSAPLVAEPVVQPAVVEDAIVSKPLQKEYKSVVPEPIPEPQQPANYSGAQQQVTVSHAAPAQPVQTVPDTDEPVTMIQFQKKPLKKKPAAADLKSAVKKKKPTGNSLGLVTEVNSKEPDQQEDFAKGNTQDDNIQRQRLIDEEERLMREQVKQAEIIVLQQKSEEKAEVAKEQQHPKVAEEPEKVANSSSDHQIPSETAPQQLSIIDRLKSVLSSKTTHTPQKAEQQTEPRQEAPSLKYLDEQPPVVHQSKEQVQQPREQQQQTPVEPSPIPEPTPPPAVQYPEPVQQQVVEEVVVISKQPKKKPVDPKKAGKKPKPKEVKIEQIAEVEVPTTPQKVQPPLEQEVHRAEPIPKNEPLLTQERFEAPSKEASRPPPVEQTFQDVSTRTNQVAESIIVEPSNPPATTHEVVEQAVPLIQQQAPIEEVAEEVIQLTFESKPKKKAGKEDKKLTKSKPAKKLEKVVVQEVEHVIAEPTVLKEDPHLHKEPEVEQTEKSSFGTVVQNIPTQSHPQPTVVQETVVSPMAHPLVEARLEPASLINHSKPEEVTIVHSPPIEQTMHVNPQPPTEEPPKRSIPIQPQPQPIIEQVVLQFKDPVRKPKKQPASKVKDFKKKKAFTSLDIVEDIEAVNYSSPIIQPNNRSKIIKQEPRQPPAPINKVMEEPPRAQQPLRAQQSPIVQPAGQHAAPAAKIPEVGISTLLSKLQLKPCYSERQNQMRETVCMIKQDILSRLLNRSTPPPNYQANQTLDKYLEENVQRHKQYRTKQKTATLPSSTAGPH